MVYDLSNKKLYPDLKLISFYKKQVRPEIEKLFLICGTLLYKLVRISCIDFKLHVIF